MWLFVKLLTHHPAKTRCRETRLSSFGNLNAQDTRTSEFTVPNGLAFCSDVRESG
jgi:hypothetical protein